jgi:phage terminase large subunit-like protein
MIRFNLDLASAVRVMETAKTLVCGELGTRYRALSADASTAFGLNPQFTIFDELGQVRGPRSSLFEALESATGALADPLSVIISTQAANDSDLLSLLIDDALVRIHIA